MADESDNPDVAADRLEAALERIANRMVEPRPLLIPAIPPEFIERLDTVIDRLKAAIG